MRKYLIAGNWKMNKTTSEALEFADEFKGIAPLSDDVAIAVIAPYTQLSALSTAFEGTGIEVGAQNVHFEPSGAYTGEISVEMLKEIGVSYCLAGHSERREYFAETDDSVNLKLKALLAAGITPILCVGESLETREAGNERKYVENQIRADFDGIAGSDASKTIVAYEPVWAIGTGKNASPEQAEDMCAFIRGMLAELYGSEVAEGMIIQYGGSMKPGNAEELLSKPDIDGGLIGGASLAAESLAEIARVAAERR